MTLTTPWHPFAAFQTGQLAGRASHQTGLTEARIYRADAARVCVIWRTDVMPAPAFTYYPTLLSAWAAYCRFRAARLSPTSLGTS